MKEKKVIDYTRTYRRIEADKKKCILYMKEKKVAFPKSIEFARVDIFLREWTL